MLFIVDYHVSYYSFTCPGNNNAFWKAVSFICYFVFKLLHNICNKKEQTRVITQQTCEFGRLIISTFNVFRITYLLRLQF